MMSPLAYLVARRDPGDDTVVEAALRLAKFKAVKDWEAATTATTTGLVLQNILPRPTDKIVTSD